MGGYFGAISHRDVGLDVFFGTDYHSHLGTRRGGMVVYGPETGFVREIHDIENTPFRTKFESALHEFKGHIGMGCISDTDPQPLLVRSHLGLYAICTVGIINNIDELIDTYFSDHGHQFMAQSSGKVNVSELVAALINMKENLVEGILYAQEMIKGSITILLMTPDGILAARDRLGRLPVLVGKHPDGSLCVSFESFAYHKLGYEDAYELGPREIVALTRNGYETVSPPGKEMKICGFLWTYYGYPNSNYEGVNVEVMRYRNGEIMARDEVAQGRLPKVDYVAGVMNNLDRTSEKSIFDHLSEHNAELADEIRKRMFVFEDIVTMDERSVQRFLRDCDPKDLVLALKGANSEVSNKIFQNMSTRMAQSIRDDLEITTNVRLRDVEEAQQRIVGIIRDLEEKNELIILKGGKDDIIA